jgi:hypothetical protein
MTPRELKALATVIDRFIERVLVATTALAADDPVNIDLQDAVDSLSHARAELVRRLAGPPHEAP